LSCAFLLIAAAELAGQRFYPDDPILKEPDPLPVKEAKRRKIDDFYDFFLNTFAQPGEKHTLLKPVRALGVNTLGEVPEGPWYENRHYRRRMSIGELVRGPGRGQPPASGSPWHIVAAKTQGVTPGFRIRDSRGAQYFLKFDPPTNPEMATAADVIGSLIFHALGYYVPDNYIVTFDRDQLIVESGVMFDDQYGKRRALSEMDVNETLMNAWRDKEGRYRAVASLLLEGDPVGPFRFFSTRTDDPNDVVPHEHRRDLRGLFVFCAWLGHDDSRAINTLDTLVGKPGARAFRHHLIDFGSILGSASTKANSARSGNEHLFAFKPAMVEFLTFGLYVPWWARVDFPDLPAVGRFEWQHFQPERYRTEYPNRAFLNRLPDDTFWAARQVMSFTDEEIRAMVKAGAYSDPKAEAWVAECLIKRRDRVGSTYLPRVLPLDQFELRGGRLDFVDLAAKHGVAPAEKYSLQWSAFDNATGAKTALKSAAGAAVPQSSARYLVAEITGSKPGKTVLVYVRNSSGRQEVVGVERTW
jgi:hypothetical protein